MTPLLAPPPPAAPSIPARSRVDELSGREGQLLALMARGYSNAGIADTLFLSPKTVETHVRSIFMKLGLAPENGGHRRVVAVLMYLAAQPTRGARAGGGSLS